MKGLQEPVGVSFKVMKAPAAEKRVLTLWASIAADADGNEVTDSHGDIITAEALEAAAWDFLARSRVIGVEHTFMGLGELVGSLFLGADLQKALNIKAPVGWLIQVRLPETPDGDAILAAYQAEDWDSASVGGWGYGEELPA
jgi:hypothetical protein